MVMVAEKELPFQDENESDSPQPDDPAAAAVDWMAVLRSFSRLVGSTPLKVSFCSWLQPM